MYGEDSVNGAFVNFAAANPITVGPVRFTGASIATPSGVAGDLFQVRISPPPETVTGYYNGRVFSILSGRAQGFSARIVNCYLSYANGPGGEYIVTLEQLASDSVLLRGRDQAWGRVGIDDDGNGTTDDLTEAGAVGSDDRLPAVGDAYLINGAEFNGVGHGYSAATGNIDQLDLTDVHPFTGVPLNSRGWFTALSNYGAYAVSPTDVLLGGTLNQGGADEPYDVADYHDVLLAYADSSAMNFGSGAVLTPTNIIPSMHRPFLVRYWHKWVAENMLRPNGVAEAQHAAFFVNPVGSVGLLSDPVDWPINGGMTTQLRPLETVAKVVELKRKIFFRPLPEDNPLFDSVAFNAGLLNFLNGGTGSQWDVNNDGDRTTDSVWIDPRFPIRSTHNGLKYKTLVALHVRDMDGRINVNYAGNWRQWQDEPGVGNQFWAPFAGNGGGGNVETFSNIALRRGRGYGPSELLLSATDLGTNRLFSNAEVESLLRTRYGTDGAPGAFGDLNDFDLVGNFHRQLAELSRRSPLSLSLRRLQRVGRRTSRTAGYVWRESHVVGLEWTANGAGDHPSAGGRSQHIPAQTTGT